VMSFFKIGSLELLARGWLWTIILLIAASWVARTTGMSHRCAACCILTVSLCIAFSDFSRLLYYLCIPYHSLLVVSFTSSSVDTLPLFSQHGTLRPSLDWHV
jgi:hypothetical protein